VAETADGMAFASEPGALIAAGLVAPRLRAAARDELLQLRFTTGAETIFEGIQRVLPAECLAIAGGAIVERRRTPPMPEGGPEMLPEAKALARFEAAFLASLAARLEGGGAGLFLPGGMGSAALLAGAARLRAGPLLAFTTILEGRGLEGRGQDGRVAPETAALARAAGLTLTPVPITRASFWACLPALAQALDDPTAEPAHIIHLLLAAAAQGQVTALLSADGSSELMAGHGRHRAAMRPWWLWGRAMRAGGGKRVA
jgi:asparagine synthase (glutamine-hydrolysing)